MNILMTCVSGGIIINDIIDLKKKYKEIKVYAADQNPKKKLIKYCDKFFKVPKGDNKNYISKIIKICEKYNISIIIPRSDEEAISLSKDKKLIEKKGIKVTINHFDKLQILNDKIATYKKIQNLFNFNLKWTIINSFNEISKIEKFMIENKFCVIKPSISRGGRNIFHISNEFSNNKQKRETTTNFENFKKKHLYKLKNKYPLILMERLYDPVYDLDLLGNKGKYVFHVLRRRINSRDPNSGHQIEGKNLWLKSKKMAKTLIENFKLDGLYDCDLMLNNKKQLNILEINPRMSGSVAVCKKANIPLLEYMLDNLKKTKIKKINLVSKFKKILL